MNQSISTFIFCLIYFSSSNCRVDLGRRVKGISTRDVHKIYFPLLHIIFGAANFLSDVFLTDPLTSEIINIEKLEFAKCIIGESEAAP